MIRDQEIERLEQYAYGLGVRKISYQKPSGDATGAEWILMQNNEVELTFYIHSRLSKKQLILNFVHELAHHISWINKGRVEDALTLEALDAEHTRGLTDQLLPKEQRKLIYLTEKEDTQYRAQIWNEVGIKIPIEYLYADIECDIWGYKQYYLNGKHPTTDKVREKLRKSRNKYNLK